MTFFSSRSVLGRRPHLIHFLHECAEISSDVLRLTHNLRALTALSHDGKPVRHDTNIQDKRTDDPDENRYAAFERVKAFLDTEAGTAVFFEFAHVRDQTTFWQWQKARLVLGQVRA